MRFVTNYMGFDVLIDLPSESHLRLWGRKESERDVEGVLKGLQDLIAKIETNDQ